MDGTLRYLSHPQVVIDPDKDIHLWSLNAAGHARVAALARSAALTGTSRIVTSAETKAMETATPLASALGMDLEIFPLMHENDRSATGYLPADAFETAADLFFAHPTDSIRGWETAAAAQARIVQQVDQVLATSPKGDILIVGHGGVGTLLYCALAGVPIDRKHDQGPGGGGCFFSVSRSDRKPQSGWRPMERMADDLARGSQGH